MSDAYSVIYSPEAIDDLREIYSYIAFTLLVPETAEKQVNRIRKEVRSLDFMPSRYSLVEWEPWKSMGMHKVPVDNFVIYYTVDDDSRTVTVIRIFYSGRNITKRACGEDNHGLQ
ncbi:type II toxin-antitoxin system RelE/ParE family toxin [bacterium 1xD8-6]|nr:type II toxin-antitoxin system RelE/ParE family toxin [bacterium D16-36]RKI68515.1 type II toxin-antitoxin system RelE/ParE family toxin [bacterium 1xD8-6]